MVQAIDQALQQEMERDDTVIVLGEDVGKDGGVFRVTEGLVERFGENRVIDTPLAESAILGFSIGAAIAGYRPVAEMQFSGFSYPAFDQMVSHAGRMRKRSQGTWTVPLVMRTPYGGGIRALEHHSESLSLIHISEPTRLGMISYAVFCLKKKNKTTKKQKKNKKQQNNNKNKEQNTNK